jgi:hypothetical protein
MVHILRKGLAVIVLGLVASPAHAEIDGHGPDAWRVTGVAVNDVLNARMGPGTDYPIIEKFAHNERGMQQITCVPFYTAAHYTRMTQAQIRALPPRWCLMRDKTMGKAGWVAARFLQEDGTRSNQKSRTAPGITGADGTPLDAANTDGEPMMVVDAPDVGLTYSLPPGWAADEPYFYETPAGARATRPTMTFYVNDREEWRALLWLNPRQMQVAGCVETEAGDLCYREQNDRQAAEYVGPMIQFDAGAVSAQ